MFKTRAIDSPGRYRSSSLLLFFLVASLFIAQASAVTCTNALLLSGYPVCFNVCASICENYCPDLALNPTCGCTTPAYGKDIFGCIKLHCSSSDVATIGTLVVNACNSLGIDVSAEVAVLESSAPTTTAITATTAAAIPTGTGKAEVTSPPTASSTSSGSTGPPIGIIVGTVVGVVGGLIIGSLAVYFLLRKRNAKTSINQTMTTNGPAEPKIQPSSDIAPTAVTAPPPQYTSTPHQPPMQQHPPSMQHQGPPMQQYQYPMQQQPGYAQQGPMQQQQFYAQGQPAYGQPQPQPPFNPYHTPETPKNAQEIAELPHPRPEPKAELGATSVTIAELR